MSFLQRLKGRGVRNDEASLQSDAEETAVDKVAQLHVDVYQTERMIVVYAQSAGADMNDVHVSIEGDADIVLIEGKRVRPEYIVFPRKVVKGAFVAEECVWGDFYRRIILPESVNIDKAEAKIKNGVLILVLPLLKPNEKEKVQLKVVGSPNPRKRSS
ncbi:Hsp20/alpha crystallin family protein [Candidatus Nomurabacteria bacterium]|nr:Hsp20/alpha crystallin family protein [Candidatus Kaiserbacteria bacterium]MCB9813864.1 Hsp20/alpha crystallin family protein [Candidatus Nomurabacteria bacterium]